MMGMSGITFCMMMMMIRLDGDSFQLEKLAARHADNSLALVHLVPEQLVRVIARATRAANDARRKRRRHFHRIRLGAKRAGEQALVGWKHRLASADRVQFTLLKTLHLVFKVRQFNVIGRANSNATSRRCNKESEKKIKKKKKKKKKSLKK
jgi:hypothetical protein